MAQDLAFNSVSILRWTKSTMCIRGMSTLSLEYYRMLEDSTMLCSSLVSLHIRDSRDTKYFLS